MSKHDYELEDIEESDLSEELQKVLAKLDELVKARQAEDNYAAHATMIEAPEYLIHNWLEDGMSVSDVAQKLFDEYRVEKSLTDGIMEGFANPDEAQRKEREEVAKLCHEWMSSLADFVNEADENEERMRVDPVRLSLVLSTFVSGTLTHFGFNESEAQEFLENVAVHATMLIKMREAKNPAAANRVAVMTAQRELKEVAEKHKRPTQKSSASSVSRLASDVKAAAEADASGALEDAEAVNESLKARLKNITPEGNA